MFQRVDDAVSGMVCVPSVPRVKVWIPVVVAVVMVSVSPPEVEVAVVWVAAVLPLSEVMVPPAPPASVPQ